MIKINAIKLEVNTSGGLFGADFQFDKGLNIIRGNNSSGKSSLFQAILYAFGFEELLGGKNEKTMQSVLRDYVIDTDERQYDVLQSFVYLEVENGWEVITLKRSVISESKKPQLIEVIIGGHLTQPENLFDASPMYVHDAGSTTNETYGFHSFLAAFLGWELPEVLSTKGDITKLFLQQIAPAFIIEQKAGWSDFFATTPYYSTKNTTARTVEFLLNLDVYKNEKTKQEINTAKYFFKSRWENLVSQIHRLAERSGGALSGIDEKPVIINSINDVKVRYTVGDTTNSLTDAIEIYKNQLSVLESKGIETVGQAAVANEKQLVTLNNTLSFLSVNYDLLQNEISLERDRLRKYQNQLQTIAEDLNKNKGALKVNKLGAELHIMTAMNVCPTCEQELKDSLLPPGIDQVPMRFEDNIAYLESQEKMIQVYINGQSAAVKDKFETLTSNEVRLTETRSQIRQIKQELIQDGRLPSEREIEKKLNLRKKIEFLEAINEELYELFEQLKELSNEYSMILANEKNLPTDFFSLNDRIKLKSLQTAFINLLGKFNYRSKTFDNIIISYESYLPVIKKQVSSGIEKQYDIIFDSSASDFIRSIWAYTISLLEVGIEYSTNHPRLLIFDEPKQQDIALEDFKSFISTLAEFENEQVIVFASFENSDEAFNETTKELTFKLHRIEHRLIKRIALPDVLKGEIEDDF